MLQQYTEQVGSGNKTAAIDMSRFRLETPKSDKGWQEAVDNSRVQIEYQNARIENLELMSKFGNAEWILYNQHCEAILDKIKKQTQEIESEIIAVNRTRQQEQVLVVHVVAHVKNT